MPARSDARPRAGRLRLLLLATLLVSPAGAARAQRLQYLPPGQFDLELGSNYQAIDGAIQNTRWQLGRIYVDPALAIRNIAYVTDFASGNLLVDSPGDRRDPDLTAGLVAGLRGYLPLGQRYAFALHALPEYTWWREQKDRRRLNGRYGAGFFGGLGRSELELSVTRDEGIRFFSREFEERVNQRTDTAEVDFQIAVVGAFSFYGEASLSRFRLIEEGQEELAALATSDRDERRLRAGVRYRFVNGVQVGIGVEDVEAEFENDNERRFTTIEGIVLGLRRSGTRWALNADVAFETVEVGLGSDPVVGEEPRGRVRLDKELGSHFGLQLYADRNLVFSVQESSPFFDDTRLGIALRSTNRARFGFRVFAETGSNEFASFDPPTVGRTDDFQAFGGEVVLTFRTLQLRLGATTTDYDSNLPQFDRRVTISRLSINFSFSRGGLTVGTGGLRLGSGEISPWT